MNFKKEVTSHHPKVSQTSFLRIYAEVKSMYIQGAIVCFLNVSHDIGVQQSRSAYLLRWLRGWQETEDLRLGHIK